jgi:electron transport complex protein RnfB
MRARRQEGVQRLAAITGQAASPEPQLWRGRPATVARIDEAWCIGCTLCIKACPTDAILGANKRMHTVIRATAPAASCACRCARWTASSWMWSAGGHRLASLVHRTGRPCPLTLCRAPRAAGRQTRHHGGAHTPGASITTAQPDTPEESSGSISGAVNAVVSSDTATALPMLVDPKKAAIAAALAKARHCVHLLLQLCQGNHPSHRPTAPNRRAVDVSQASSARSAHFSLPAPAATPRGRAIHAPVNAL